VAQLDDALSAAHVPFVYVEGERDIDPVQGLRVVIAPTYEFADPERWRRLSEFAARGGTVVWGPQLPRLDLDLRPRELQPIGPRGPARVRDASDADALVQSLIEEHRLQQPFPVSPRTLRSTVHEDARGPRVVFVLNHGGHPEHAELRLPARMALVDALSGERFVGTDSISMPMAAWGCRMLLVEEGSR
jgi:hypothetical protein